MVAMKIDISMIEIEIVSALMGAVVHIGQG
jgi:hypothetical protein